MRRNGKKREETGRNRKKQERNGKKQEETEINTQKNKKKQE